MGHPVLYIRMRIYLIKGISRENLVIVCRRYIIDAAALRQVRINYASDAISFFNRCSIMDMSARYIIGILDTALQPTCNVHGYKVFLHVRSLFA